MLHITLTFLQSLNSPPTLFELAIFAHGSKVNNYTRIDSPQRARLWPETPLREGGEGVHVPFRVRLHTAAQGPRARQVGFPLSLFHTLHSVLDRGDPSTPTASK